EVGRYRQGATVTGCDPAHTRSSPAVYIPGDNMAPCRPLQGGEPRFGAGGPGGRSSPGLPTAVDKSIRDRSVQGDGPEARGEPPDGGLPAGARRERASGAGQ